MGQCCKQIGEGYWKENVGLHETAGWKLAAKEDFQSKTGLLLQ